MEDILERSSKGPMIIVHGGAGNTIFKDNSIKFEGIKDSVRAGFKVLSSSNQETAAVDAVEAAIKVLEDHPEFNAGHGSFLTEDRTVEMDALIMDGRDLNAGAVAMVKNVKNPVSAARIVMEDTDHVLIGGDAADRLALRKGLANKPTEYFYTDAKIEYLNQFLEKKSKELIGFGQEARNLHSHSGSQPNITGHDTVGAVAMDMHGNIAAATSTGGLNGKMVGRIGDSPLVGSGGYADNSVGGVSTTGKGEDIARVNLAFRTIVNMECGLRPRQAIEKAVKVMEEKVDGVAGAIVLDRAGRLGAHTNTNCMVWAAIKDGKLFYGVNPDDIKEDDVVP